MDSLIIKWFILGGVVGFCLALIAIAYMTTGAYCSRVEEARERKGWGE